MQHRQRLLSRIGDLTPGKPLPIVTLEEFFEGNTFMESIIDDLNFRYRPATLYSMFKKFRAINGIHDVYVEIKEIGRPESWPVADTFWVVAELDPRRYQLPREFWGDQNLPCDYLSYPRKDERVTDPIPIPDGMIATGLQYYNIHD
jgi:hypothetical protein